MGLRSKWTTQFSENKRTHAPPFAWNFLPSLYIELIPNPYPSFRSPFYIFPRWRTCSGFFPPGNLCGQTGEWESPTSTGRCWGSWWWVWLVLCRTHWGSRNLILVLRNCLTAGQWHFAGCDLFHLHGLNQLGHARCPCHGSTGWQHLQSSGLSTGNTPANYFTKILENMFDAKTQVCKIWALSFPRMNLISIMSPCSDLSGSQFILVNQGFPTLPVLY